MRTAPAHLHPSLRGLSRVELEVMRRDGEVARFGAAGFEFYLPLGVVPSRADRAASLAPLMRPGRVLTHEAAHWLHHGGPAPDRIRICRKSGRRPAALPPQVEWCFRRLDPADVVEVAGLVAATSPERTAADLAAEARSAQAFCTRYAS